MKQALNGNGTAERRLGRGHAPRALVGLGAQPAPVGLRALLALRALLPLTALAALMVPAACAPSRGSMLEGEIAQAVQTNPGHIDLGRLYPAPWDRVCVLMPEITKARADSVLGFHYSAAQYLVARADVTGLVFVRGKRVVAAVRYPRVDGDFTAAGRSYCLPRDRAIFVAVGPLNRPGGPKLLPASMPAGGGRS